MHTSKLVLSLFAQVYLDVGLCERANQNRTLGENAFCKDPEGLGRIVIGTILNTPCDLHLREQFRESYAESRKPS